MQLEHAAAHPSLTEACAPTPRNARAVNALPSASTHLLTAPRSVNVVRQRQRQLPLRVRISQRRSAPRVLGPEAASVPIALRLVITSMATDGISTTPSAQTESAFRPKSAAAALPLRTVPKACATQPRSAVWVLPDRNVRPRPSAAPNSAIPGQPLAPSTANWEVHARLPTTAGLEDATIASARSSLWINLVQ
ncbi:hypothetical protein CF327_g7711 [Tilletia walkeri]|uniref:Uncharacterized protein n=1 Tax=Tilletia walkeri TaxID=117179 RepID=A0A8X7T0X7_9BASI|nr:hypothetical protein CF327_g7711 [Tilletia walkeri]KAE8257959.1 hypothetical protein A4X09_0g7876 [Tilletia walkeri]